MWHSCGRFTLENHFKGKAPNVRAAFDRLRAIIERCGPVEIIPQKTRIVFLTRMRFAAAMPRTKWLEGHLILARRSDDPRFSNVVRFGPTTYVHSYRAEDATFLTELLPRWCVNRTFAANKNIPRVHAGA
ncbi:MAG: DUF5655 domain-containing protein [Gemmatimonadota bacterium]